MDLITYSMDLITFKFRLLSLVQIFFMGRITTPRNSLPLNLLLAFEDFEVIQYLKRYICNCNGCTVIGFC